LKALLLPPDGNLIYKEKETLKSFNMMFGAIR
jgi:hypothetical protein